MDIKRIPQLLLVAGTGRNTGKTTFICNIIRKFSVDHSIVALKITPHFHKNIPGSQVIVSRDDLYIARESDPNNGKDSSLMLAAGAQASYFIMARDEQLELVWQEIDQFLLPGTLIVCESGGLRDLVVPGLFFMMQHEGQETIKPGAATLKLLADRVITFDGKKINFDPETIEIKDNQWILKR